MEDANDNAPSFDLSRQPTATVPEHVAQAEVLLFATAGDADGTAAHSTLVYVL